MNWRTTLGLFAALILLTAGYFGMQWMRVVEVVEQQQAKRLFTFEPEAVTDISIERIGEAASAASREPGGAWTIREPNPTIAPFGPLWDRVAINLAALNQQRALDTAGLELSDYGLDVPALVFKATAAGEAIEFRFGALEPTQEFRYALLNGDRLMLIHKDQFFELNRPLEELRNRFTVDDREAGIVRFEFAHIWTGQHAASEAPAPVLENAPAIGEESPPIIASRATATDVWRMEAPWTSLANQEVVDGLVKELQFAVGRNFVDNPENLSDYGLQPASYRITLTDDAGGKAQTFLFGHVTEENGGVFVRRADRDGLFVIDAHIITLFPRAPSDFQERRLLTRQALEFGRIDIEGPGDTFSIIDTPEGGWQIENETSFITDYNAVSAYIGALKNARGIEFLEGEPAQFGLDAPERRITLHPKTEGEPAVILLKPHPTNAELYYAKQDLGPVFEIDRAAAEPLLASRLYFRSRFLLRFNPAEAVSLYLNLEGTAYAFKKAHGLWVVEQPADKALASQGEIERLVDTLAKLVATRNEPEAADPAGSQGLDAPVLTFEVGMVNADGAASTAGPLSIGAVTPDEPLQRFASVAGREGVYRVRQQLIDELREFLRGLTDK
jgi:hypothetical protein